jgi:hypothetical protein
MGALFCARLSDLDLEQELFCPARCSAFTASALPDGLYFDCLRHEFIAERFEICDNLRASRIRRFGKADKTKTLFGFVHKIFGVQHSSREIMSANVCFKCNYAWLKCYPKNLLGFVHAHGVDVMLERNLSK